MSAFERIKSFLPATTESGDIESMCAAIVLRQPFVKTIDNGDPINVLYYNYCITDVEKDFEVGMRLHTGNAVVLQVDSRQYITHEHALSLIDTICSSCQMIMKQEPNV